MKVTMLVALILAASGSVGPAVAEDNGTPEQQRDCMGDALAHCGQYIFAPDRNAQMADCLWQHRAQISKECLSHLHPPAPPSQRPSQRRPAPR